MGITPLGHHALQTQLAYFPEKIRTLPLDVIRGPVQLGTYKLTVDNCVSDRQLLQSITNRGKTTSPVFGVARKQSDLAVAEFRQQSVTVKLEFMNPLISLRRVFLRE